MKRFLIGFISLKLWLHILFDVLCVAALFMMGALFFASEDCLNERLYTLAGIYMAFTFQWFWLLASIIYKFVVKKNWHGFFRIIYLLFFSFWAYWLFWGSIIANVGVHSIGDPY